MNTLGSFVISPNQSAITLDGMTLAELDGALADLSANTLLVAQRRNKHILATHTNQDVLEIIFSAVIDRQGSAGLRFVSQVCQEWQRVALGAPLLWRKALSLSVNRNWMFEMVRCTMQVPLTIHVSHQGFQGGVVYTNLLSIADQFWRFETLEFNAPYPYICEFFGLVPFDGNEAPYLRVLSLCGQNWQGFPSDEILPDKLLTLSTPNLEHLAVENFPFGWDALTSGLARSMKLSVLHICYHGESEAPHTLSISELLATLACMTLLRELKLRNVLNATNGNLFMERNIPATMLPALQILDLQANIQFCSGFLNGVEAPVLVELDVECNTTDETRNKHQFMTSQFMIGVGRTAPHNPYDILAAICNKGELWVLLQSSRTGAFCQILLPQANNDLVLECILRQLADMPSVRNTKSLEISLGKDAHNKVVEEAWSYLLERLNSVSSLNLSHYLVPCILRSLYRNVKGAHDAQRQSREVSVLLPFLETITVAASSKLCVLVDMIAELREPVGASIDRYVILRGTDTYHALWEHVTTWLEGGDPSVQIEDDEENAKESD